MSGNTENEGKKNACERIHRILERLPEHSSPDGDIPSNGLYFFYEDGEICPHTGKPRIVRVGNHPRSQNGLRNRLKMHYGGNKNSSVFRKFLGGAILRKRNPNYPCLQPGPGKGHWERQDEKTCELCRPIENEVTELLKKNFKFRCVEIVDKDERNDMEKKLIATLSKCPQCGPSNRWLGLWAYNEKVKSSGLWNSDYVDEPYEMTPSDLEKFEGYAKSGYNG